MSSLVAGHVGEGTLGRRFSAKSAVPVELGALGRNSSAMLIGADDGGALGSDKTTEPCTMSWKVTLDFPFFLFAGGLVFG